MVENIVLDIETVASPDCAEFLDPVKAPANYKDADKIAAYKAERLADVITKAALEPDLCEVVAVGFSIDNGQTVVAKTRHDMDEPALLQFVWTAVSDRNVIGFNVLGFDLPVLIRRSQILSVRYPALVLDRYRTPHIDMLQKLTFNGQITYRSLAFYCRRLGIPCDDKITGADIAELVANEDWEAIKAHVRADVAKTTKLAKRLAWLTV